MDNSTEIKETLEFNINPAMAYAIFYNANNSIEPIVDAMKREVGLVEKGEHHVRTFPNLLLNQLEPYANELKGKAMEKATISIEVEPHIFLLFMIAISNHRDGLANLLGISKKGRELFDSVFDDIIEKTKTYIHLP